MDVSSKQPEGGRVGGTGRSPVHGETLSTAVGCDSKYGGICTVFFVDEAGYVERLEERADIPYMDLACVGPGGDKVGLRDGGQGC